MWRFYLLLAVCVSAQAARPLVLADNGKSSYSICLARDASPSEKRGADELQRFLFEMSGARLPVVSEADRPRGSLILVGRSALADRLAPRIPYEQLGAEGVALKTAGRHLIIAGGRQRGTLYGVYTFLEKLGCRWFTREVSRIPTVRRLTVPRLDETQKPAFEYREAFFTEAFDRDWAARNKLNGAHMELDESTGGKIQYYPFVHSFYRMIPPEKHFKDHPEYFSLIDGKRRIERGQLCLTNPDVLRMGVEAVLEWIRKHPEATIYSVSQNDWEGWCECDNCRRVEEEEGGAHSGPILRYVNALAAEIEKQHPGKLIDTLAYWYSEAPPRVARPRRNVRIRLCPIGACEAHPYEKCDRDAYFTKNLKAWSKITDQLYIWHYNTNFTHYLIPFPDFDELAADIPMYRRHGVVGLFLQGAYAKGGGGENAELRSYVMAKLLWNTKADVEQHVAEFHDAVYGKAAAPMRAYFELQHRQVRFPPQGEGRHIWIFVVPDFSDDFVRQARELFRQAEAAAEDDAVRARVRKARLSLDYFELLRDRQYMVREGWYAPPDLDRYKLRFADFLAAARRFGITRLHEWEEIGHDEKQVAEMRPLRVLALENDSLRLEVVPELAGRVIALIDRRTARNALRRVDSGERGYPNPGGLAAFAYPDMHGRAYELKWEPVPLAWPDELVLTGTGPGGLRLWRRLRLDGAVLHTETLAENTGSVPVEVVLQSRAEADTGNIDDAAVVFRAQDGAAVERRLVRPEEQPTGSETQGGGSRPDGEWRVTNRGQTLLRNRFPKEQVPRTFFNWSGKGPHRVTLGLWSEPRRLAPGETVRLECSYKLE